jgi:hypothetical protein
VEKLLETMLIYLDIEIKAREYGSNTKKNYEVWMLRSMLKRENKQNQKGGRQMKGERMYD